MADEKDDIIRYREGSMSAAERHAMEKKALSDPFLADALEGAGSVSSKDFSADVHLLSGKILGQSTKVWYSPVRIAAGLAILIGTGVALYFYNTPPPQLAFQKPISLPSDSLPIEHDSASNLLTLANPIEAVKEPKISSTPTAAGQTKVDQSKMKDETKDAAISRIEKTESQSQPIALADQEAEKSKVISMEISEDKEIVRKAPGLASGPSAINNKSDQGLVGSKAISTENRTRADMNVKADSISLSEIIVASGAVKKKEAQLQDGAQEKLELAQPVGGNDAFRKYLESNIRYPSKALSKNTQGNVIVQFVVNPNGSLSGFTVIEKIGDGCEEELIRLIKNGPPWIPTRADQTNREDKVKVRLRFSLPR